LQGRRAVTKCLLVFGGSGFVGGYIARVAQEVGWEAVVAGSRVTPAPGRLNVDVTDVESVRAAMDAASPDVVVNAAAHADVDRAEREPGLTWRVNADGARHVALACRERGVRCIYYSTDVVFDGCKESYTEEDAPAPLNHYGRSKAAGERATLECCPGAAVVRVSLVLGYPLERGNAYLPKLRERLIAGQQAPSPADEIRTPIDVVTAAAATVELAGGDFTGLLHIGATRAVDRYTLARMLAAEMGLRDDLILPYAVYPAGSEATRALRHKNGVLDVSLAQRVLRTPMLSAEETVRRAVEGFHGA
jgi:dTDP-4-dehydrorhamnose reductase